SSGSLSSSMPTSLCCTPRLRISSSAAFVAFAAIRCHLPAVRILPLLFTHKTPICLLFPDQLPSPCIHVDPELRSAIFSLARASITPGTQYRRQRIRSRSRQSLKSQRMVSMHDVHGGDNNARVDCFRDRPGGGWQDYANAGQECSDDVRHVHSPRCGYGSA